MNNRMITVFTPLYNRKDLLPRLYESLTHQTNYGFEWLICDDCSVDGSYELAKELAQKENRFRIRVDRTEQNGGKHRAINRGVAMAEGFLFFIVDSDDMLTENAIEKILEWEKTIQNEKNFGGLGFLKADLSRNCVGTTFPESFCDCTSLEREENNISGDKAEVYYTDVMKAHPFPAFAGERFLTEAVVWDRIAHDGLKVRWINEIIYLCEYQADGLSSNWFQNLANNPEGYTLWLKQKLEYGVCFGYERFLMVYGYYTTINLAKRYSLKHACDKLGYPAIKAYLYVPVLKAKRLYSRLTGNG